MNEPELGARIDPGMAFSPFSSSILEKTRRDLNPQPLDCKLSLLTTRLDVHPNIDILKCKKLNLNGPWEILVYCCNGCTCSLTKSGIN
jgi:hypothetical protein